MNAGGRRPSFQLLMAATGLTAANALSTGEVVVSGPLGSQLPAVSLLDGQDASGAEGPTVDRPAS